MYVRMCVRTHVRMYAQERAYFVCGVLPEMDNVHVLTFLGVSSSFSLVGSFCLATSAFQIHVKLVSVCVCVRAHVWCSVCP